MTAANNLPAELTSFVGREQQLAELRRVLHRSRLITLTGPGGAGKTRLALKLAAGSLDRFPDGVWLVELATIGDPRLLEQTLAAICGVNEETSSPLREAIAASLARARTLLLLDSCEHLVESCADVVVSLLKACPRLRIVVTSREPLGVAGEVIWRTPSLSVPSVDDALHPELLMQSEAIRLFVDRARLSRQGFDPRAESAPTLAQICTRLEGIPLAIELAAGLAGMMTLEEILDRLGHRFRLLTGGSRSSLPRHQTLREAVDWSFGLLGPTEQVMFGRLGIFAGGFEIDAAEAVVTGEPIQEDQVVPMLSRLVHKSLVVAEPVNHHTRFRMLDTIREYALEKLQQHGHADWRQRHAEYFTTWTVEATSHLSTSEQIVWMRRLDDEQPNIRLAMEWHLAENPDEALRLVSAMTSYWWMTRTFEQGLDWLARALRVDSSKRDLRAAALFARARFVRRKGDYDGAFRDVDEVAKMARELGRDDLMSRALNVMGVVTKARGDSQKALDIFTEALQLAQKAGDQDREAASRNNIAFVMSAMGDQEGALLQITQAMGIAEEMGDRFLAATLLDTLGRVQYRLQDYEGARASWLRALHISAEFDDTLNIPDCLEGIGLLAASVDRMPARAITLLSAAESLRLKTGIQRAIEEMAEFSDAENRATARLTREQVDTARRQGAQMTARQAAGFALGETSNGHRPPGPLTERQTEVARLLAKGMTNGEVADQLRISERTVDSHVEHIRNKLGLRTRTQIAVWTRERLGSA